MKRFWIIIAFFVLVLPSFSLSETLSKIAAVVNDEVITTYQLDQAVAARKKGFSSEQLPALRRDILDKLIEELLVQQRIKELRLGVSEGEIEDALQDIQKQNNLTRSQLISALERQGMSFDDYLDNIRKQLLRLKLMNREVQSKIDVTNREISEYFRIHIDDFRGKPYLRLSNITFDLPRKASESQIEAVRAEAEGALARLKQGEPFAEVLQQYRLAKKADGGDMGTFHKGELDPAFEQAVWNLEGGGVSGLIEMPEALYILKVTEKSAEGFRKFDTVKDEIREEIRKQKSEEGFKNWVRELKEKAYIDIRLK